jgi:hypothetical protein
MTVTDFESAKLETLRKRASAVRCRIVIDHPEACLEDFAPDHGPYTLVCAESGYFAHAGGCNLTVLELEIAQIEEEFRTGTGLFALEAIENPFESGVAP